MDDGAISSITTQGHNPEANLPYTSNIESPLLISSPSEIDWDGEASIVVVGFGGAGVVSTLQAIEDGGDVIVVDRFTGGGATEKSGGVVYAGGTEHQHKAGYNDTPEQMFKYLRHEGVPVSDRTLQRFCESSAKDLDWISSFGVEFGSASYEERTAYPPDGYYLYYSGMEKFSAEVAEPSPRGHRTVGKGATGKYYFQPLKDAALAGPVKFYPHSPVRRLIIDESGRVLGVEVQEIPEVDREQHEKIYKKVDPYKPLNGAKSEKAIAECAEFEANVKPIRKRYLARDGVVLCSGGYNYNLELFSRYRPIISRAYPDIVRGGSMGCDGSGIELGQTAGGTLSHMDQLFCTKAISPPHDFIYGVLVNAEGKRFISEDAYVGSVGCAVSEQSNDGTAWVILDSKTFWAGIRQALWPLKNIVSWWGMPVILNLLFGGTKRASSIEKLAKKLNMDADNLAVTISQYNVHANDGVDPECGKLAEHIRAQSKGPFFAYNLSMRNKWGFSGTMPYGGLVVDEDTGAVVDSNARPIPGLYAAGRTAVGICSEANFSGLSIADTIFSGRRAARSARRINHEQ